MDVASYLERIGYRDALDPTRATLDGLIAQHQATVPFENIDIVRLHRPITLDQGAMFDKIVGERRGGFCYELNGLFAELLTEIGFAVTRGYGVWPDREGVWTVPFEHIVLVAEAPGVGEHYLVDVGFGGDSPVVAVPLVDGQIRMPDAPDGTGYRAIWLSDTPQRWRIEARRDDADWGLIYEVDLTPRSLAEFGPRCAYLQTASESHFTQSLICSRPLPNGRVTLGGGKLILTTDGDRVERSLAGYDDEQELLRDWFGIEIDPARYGDAR